MEERKDKLTPEEFVLRAIEVLRIPPYKGIHTVYSGFNEAFREYFPGLDPVQTISQMAEEGEIIVRPARKGGAVIYKLGEVPRGIQAKKALRKILGEE